MNLTTSSVKKRIVCNCDQNILRVNGRLFRAVVENKNIAQELAEELALIFGVSRCVIFKIFGARHDSAAHCEIVARVPVVWYKNEYDPLAKHPDIQMIYAGGAVHLITDPLKNIHTQYFIGEVVDKGINQILYIPLTKKHRMQIITAVIVLDAIGSDTFSEEQIVFCECLREIISNTLNVYDFLQQDLRDRLRNPAAVMGGFCGLIGKKAAMIEARSWEIAISAQIGKFATEKMEEVKSLANQIAAMSRKIEEILDGDRSRML